MPQRCNRAKARLEELKEALDNETGIVAIEPNSGDHYLGATLGQADAAAYAQHPDEWVYFVRLDALGNKLGPEARITNTGVAAGEKRGKNRYPRETVNGRVEQRLRELADQMRDYGGGHS